MNRILKRFIALSLACGMIFATGANVFAATKAEAQQKIRQLQQEQEALEERLAELEQNKEDTESYIRQLDDEMTAIVEDIREVNERLEALDAKITETEQNLAAAEEKAENQYAALKLRIKQMYEQGDPTLFEILLKSEDITAALNSSEYISRISDFDDQLLAAFNETVRQIDEYKQILEEQREEQEQIKAELEWNQESLQAVIDQKNQELISLGLDIEDAYTDISNTEEALAETEQILAQILDAERRAAEEAARRAAAANNSGAVAGSSYSGTVTTGSGILSWPCAGGYISSGYGGRTSPTAGASSDHMGVDIAANAGTAILAADSGTVVTVAYSSARGNYVVVSHGNGMSTLYQHCSAVYVTAGQNVSKGASIAAVGSTGIATGPHLHFEVLVNGMNVNPSNYL